MIYSLVYTLAFLVYFPLLMLRGKSRRKYLASFKERLGFYSQQPNPQKQQAIWIHTVSVGESNAAKSLVADLKKSYPAHRIIVSATTLTGLANAKANLSADAFIYFPFDWRFAIRKALKATNAKICVVLETELWPNFLRLLSKKKIPVVLANGRISDKSYKNYSLLRCFFAPLLKKYFLLGAQSQQDCDRLIQLGAPAPDTVTTGNLKYDAGQYSLDQGKVAELQTSLAIDRNDMIFIAGSTHEGEELAALRAYQQAKQDNLSLRLFIVPRKPERFDAVAAELTAEKIEFQRYSEYQQKPLTAPVILVDAMGLLLPLYHLSQIAFVGGSLTETGGHNILEACQADLPVLFGPNMQNFRDISQHVISKGAGLKVQSADELAQKLSELLNDSAKQQEMSTAAKQVMRENQDALPKTLRLVADALPWSGIRQQPIWHHKLLASFYAWGSSLIKGNPVVELRQGKRMKNPVISVGGLSFGGAGKTPMVGALIDHFIKQSKKVALLTRGYKADESDSIIVSDGAGKIEAASKGGDEPVMLAHRYPQLFAIKDSDRFRGAIILEDKFNPDIFILDDGYQHRKMARDFNLLMLDADSIAGPRSTGQLFREPFSFTEAADAIVLLQSSAKRTVIALQVLSQKYPDIPIFKASIETLAIIDPADNKEYSAANLQGKKLLAVCGIAIPSRFFSTLLQNKLSPIAIKTFPDHHNFKQSDISQILAMLSESDADAIITTEKDLQRLASLQEQLPEGKKLFVLKTDLKLENFDRLIEKIEVDI
jgi:3-deoxy-D-manno-octulosonic-acid transferase